MTYQNPTNPTDKVSGRSASEGIRDYREQASEMGHAALDTARRAGPEIRRSARRATSGLQQTVRDYPVASLVTTTTVAFLLGVLWSAGSRRGMTADGWFGRSTRNSWLDNLQHYAEPRLRALGTRTGGRSW